jgi:hypothetical protein
MSMRNVGRKLAFVVAACIHDTMIVKRFDHRMTEPGQRVGFRLFEAGGYDPVEFDLALQLIEQRRGFRGVGVVAINCGANIGIYAIEWATAMTGWGSVIAIEAQERLYYALVGNIAINNCFNAIAVRARLPDRDEIRQPRTKTVRLH